MILADSSVLIDYFNGVRNWQTDALDQLLGREVVAIGDFVLVEVLQGFRNDGDYVKAKQMLLQFPCFELCGPAIAVRSAENYRTLKKKGFTIRATIDVVIATFCIENGVALLHNDRDFIPFEKMLGLQCVNKGAEL